MSKWTTKKMVSLVVYLLIQFVAGVRSRLLQRHRAGRRPRALGRALLIGGELLMSLDPSGRPTSRRSLGSCWAGPSSL